MMIISPWSSCGDEDDDDDDDDDDDKGQNDGIIIYRRAVCSSYFTVLSFSLIGLNTKIYL